MSLLKKIVVSILMLHQRLQMQNTYKLVGFYIYLQQISYCYRWIYVVLVTKHIRNKALRH